MAPIVEEHKKRMNESQATEKKPVSSAVKRTLLITDRSNSVVIGVGGGSREGNGSTGIANPDGELCCYSYYFDGITVLFQ